MTTAATPPARRRTMADLLHDLGDIPPERVRLWPLPGTATEADILERERAEGSLFELVDGVLVEKAMGYRESILAGYILRLLHEFIQPRNLGFVSGADGT